MQALTISPWFFLQQIPCHNKASVLNLPLFFSAARSGWRIPCTIGVAKMHLSKWNGWTLHLGALVFGGWRYHRMSWVTRPEPDHSPSTKNIFRVIHCSTCCQPTLFCFWGGCTRLLTPLPCLTLVLLIDDVPTLRSDRQALQRSRLLKSVVDGPWRSRVTSLEVHGKTHKNTHNL